MNQIENIRTRLTPVNSWKILAYAGTRGRRHHYAWCVCGCGKVKKIEWRSITSGNSRQCKSCSLKKHGHTTHRSASPEYNAWLNMVRRSGTKYSCSTKTRKNYRDRGIFVCAQWEESFETFLSDMGHRPSLKHSIDRIDNDNGYEPSNCRWATKSDQLRNTRRNVILEFNGLTKCLSDWADEYSIKRATLHSRLFILGWSLEKALMANGKPVRQSQLTHQ